MATHKIFTWAGKISHKVQTDQRMGAKVIIIAGKLRVFFADYTFQNHVIWRRFISQSDCADVQPQKEQTEQNE